MINIEIIYSNIHKEIFQKMLELPEGTPVLQALELSGIFELHPETQKLSYGIFSHPADAEQLLKNGDRVEVYRELTSDPKEKRRLKHKLI